MREGFISAEAAKRDYGVGVTDGKLDVEATAALRKTLEPEK